MKKVVLTVLIIVMMVVGGMKMIDAMSPHRVDESQYLYHSYCVQYGDTLWSIAEENALNTDDLRDYIYSIEQINGCGANIKAGNYLIILVQPLDN